VNGAFTRGRSSVHKFNVAISDTPTTLPLSPSAQVVHVAAQAPAFERTLQLWAVTLIDAQGRPPFSGAGRRFEVYGTGQPIPGNRHHVGSVLVDGFVWHVFEDRGEVA
jgi:hypothetical protein